MFIVVGSEGDHTIWLIILVVSSIHYWFKVGSFVGFRSCLSSELRHTLSPVGLACQAILTEA